MAIRVLIVDDSPFFREVLRHGLSRFPDIEIIGEASDGQRALRLVLELQPDVVTMDVVMPMLGGLDAIRSIMAERPTPIIVLSDVHNDSEQLALRATEVGAIDTFAKPAEGFTEDVAERLAALLRSAAHVKVERKLAPRRATESSSKLLRKRLARLEIVGVVASTGGPQTLRRLVRELLDHSSPAIAIVQHTSVGFAEALTSWLTGACGRPVSTAQEGQRISPGMIVVAPDERHLEIQPGGIAHLHQGPRRGGHRPSGTLLLSSLAASFGPGAAGVVLTGMGDDGAEGARAIEARGGLVFIEDPGTAILEGMPRAAIELTRAPIIAPAENIGRMLRRPPVGPR